VNFKRTINVKENFIRAQEVLGFSRRTIAERAEMPAGSLSGILTHNNPKVYQLLRLSRGVGISIEYLITGGDPLAELSRNYHFFANGDEPVLKEGWDPPLPNVAARVAIILKQTGKTKRQVGKRIQVIPSWWAPILQRNNPTVGVIERMAYALQVPPVRLVEPVTYAEYGKVMIPPVRYQ